MSEFNYQYNLPTSAAPFSIIRGGVSLFQAAVCDQSSARICANSTQKTTGEINWTLKDPHTGSVFAVRQLIQDNAHSAVQSERQLRSGLFYETVNVTSPAPLARKLRKPEQSALASGPAFGMAQGTYIMTARGEVRIEDLVKGDRLVTRDKGMQKLLWVGTTRPKQAADTPMVRFTEGAIHNNRDLVVCSNQLIVFKGPEALAKFGTREVLAEAQSFVNHGTITYEKGQSQNFYQMLLSSHEVIYAEAAACESFMPTRENLAALPLIARLDVHMLLPDLQENPASFGPMARSRVGATLN